MIAPPVNDQDCLEPVTEVVHATKALTDDPNRVERSVLYISAAELLAPPPVRQRRHRRDSLGPTHHPRRATPADGARSQRDARGREAHLLAIFQELTEAEQAFILHFVQQLPSGELLAWIQRLTSMSVDEAIAFLRAPTKESHQ